MEFGNTIAGLLQRSSHQEAVEVNSSGAEGKLGQFEHDAHLNDELHPFSSRGMFFGG